MTSSKFLSRPYFHSLERRDQTRNQQLLKGLPLIDFLDLEEVVGLKHVLEAALEDETGSRFIQMASVLSDQLAHSLELDKLDYKNGLQE